MNENGQVTVWLMLPQIGAVVKATTCYVTGVPMTEFDISCIVGLFQVTDRQGSGVVP